MDAVERAVRAALEKGDARDRAFRVKIYASAQAALERTLAARGADAPQLDQRRKHLASIIKTVELGYLEAADAALGSVADSATDRTASPRITPDEVVAPAVVAVPRATIAPEPPHAPRVPPVMVDDPAAATIPAFRREPVFAPGPAPVTPAAPPRPVAVDDGPAALPHPERRVEARSAGSGTLRPSRARGRPVPWVRWGFNAAFLLAIGLGGWWLYGEAMRQYDLALNAGGKPQLAEAGAPGQADAEARLVEIFAPTDAQLITAPPGTEAKLARSDGMDALSIRTTNAGTPVSIAVGQGVLQTYAGQRVLFNIKARAEGAAVVDTSVGCSFGGLGECERKRFRIAPEIAEYMFAVTLAAGAPTGDGVITFEPDVSGGGAAVQIFAIRVSPVEGG